MEENLSEAGPACNDNTLDCGGFQVFRFSDCIQNGWKYRQISNDDLIVYK